MKPRNVLSGKDAETNSDASWQASALLYNVSTQAFVQKNPLAHQPITNMLHPDNPAEHSFFARLLLSG